MEYIPGKALREVCKHTIRYSMVFHDSPVTPAELTRLGAAFNYPFIVFPTGTAPLVVLSTLKQAGDGDGIILLTVPIRANSFATVKVE
jgi:hypothetical protein